METLRLKQLLLVVLLVTVEAETDFCVSGTPNSTDPAPPSISQTYQAHVEVNILDQNFSLSIDEFLDYDGNRGLIKVYKLGNIESYIFSYVTNEVFDVKDGVCTVYTVLKSPYNFLLGPNNVTGAPHIFDGPTSLRFSNSSKPVYNGTANIRGIPADVWSLCLNWTGAVGPIRATYYFSRIGWNTSAPLQQIPLRIEVQGLTSLSFNNGQGPASTLSTPRQFHHIYEFIGFTPYIDALPTIFQTPAEVVCANRTNVQSLPTFQTHFQYKAEIVDSVENAVTHYAMWYNERYKLVREDTRTVDPTSGIPVSSTQIHDFNTEVRYIMNENQDCIVKSIDPSEADTDEDVSRFHFNGSLFVDIRDPNSFFVLNYNYTYTGQRQIRGMTCDIFSTNVSNYDLGGVTYSAIFEYAFLTTGWTDLPLYTADTSAHNYPVQLLIAIPSQMYTRQYNFFDFAEGNVTYPTFDISSCFDETQKLGFQLTFPGAYDAAMQDTWTLQIYESLLSVMTVYPARIGGITITSDSDNVYVSAYLLSTSVAAQFNLTGQTLEQTNDKTIKGITTMDECAALCVDNNDFVCEGFQYCPDDGFACRLGKNHQASHGAFLNSTACNEYSRNVKTANKREPLIKEAYALLQAAVTAAKFKVSVANAQTTTLTPFTAIDVKIVSGKFVENKALPSLPGAFSYRMEIVEPKSTSAQEIFVWFDDNLNIARYDQKDQTSDMQDMLTIILDFNSGVASEINQRTKECREMPIPNSQVFDAIATDTMTNGAIRVTMKTANAFFFLDDTYTFIGEGTTRGILCDVFESIRGDFNEDHTNTSNKDTVFKYFFQSSSWAYISPQSTKSATSQPVQLNIEDKSTGDYLVYSFYDFTDGALATSFYDTTSCYDVEETKSFVLQFENQAYHPVLDEADQVFLQAVLNMLSSLTFMSPINFQKATLTYDDSGIYVVVTALGHTSYFNLFSPVMYVTQSSLDSQISALSSSDCASACVQNKAFVCNSFDYCPGVTGPNCLLGAQQGETAPDVKINNGTCTHFSRTENDTYKDTSIQQMYLIITNTVYDKKFVVNVQLLNGTNVTFQATSVRDNILLPDDPSSTGGADLLKFNTTFGYQLNTNLINETKNAVSVTDCAMYCIQENTYDCQAFDYQFKVGTCRLTSIHPDQLNSGNSGITVSQFYNVYARLYTLDYNKMDGIVYDTDPDKIILNVQSDELCARACDMNADFVCEAFETCSDSSCKLRKTHYLNYNNSGAPSTDCSYYARNHIFDYNRHDNKDIQGHDDSSLNVNTPSDCAQLCATGQGLPGCASFEICHQNEGTLLCVLSKADPTIQKNLVTENSMMCSLYTKANPGTVIAAVNMTTCPTIPRQPTGTTPKGVHTINTATPGTAGGQCSSQNGSPSDTGARVGIAFGTLILGLLVGAACMLLFMRFRYGRGGVQEDATVLKTWDN